MADAMQDVRREGQQLADRIDIETSVTDVNDWRRIVSQRDLRKDPWDVYSGCKGRPGRRAHPRVGFEQLDSAIARIPFPFNARRAPMAKSSQQIDGLLPHDFVRRAHRGGVRHADVPPSVA